MKHNDKPDQVYLKWVFIFFSIVPLIMPFALLDFYKSVANTSLTPNWWSHSVHFSYSKLKDLSKIWIHFDSLLDSVHSEFLLGSTRPWMTSSWFSSPFILIWLLVVYALEPYWTSSNTFSSQNFLHLFIFPLAWGAGAPSPCWAMFLSLCLLFKEVFPDHLMELPLSVSWITPCFLLSQHVRHYSIRYIFVYLLISCGSQPLDRKLDKSHVWLCTTFGWPTLGPMASAQHTFSKLPNKWVDDSFSFAFSAASWSGNL